MSPLAGIARTSLSDHVYQRLLEAIHSGLLAGGTALHVADLATQFSVSPSPVRDAISRLAGDGLVVNNPNRRTTVVTFTKKDIAETFQLRGILECAAVHLAAQRVTPAQLSELHRVAEECDSLAADPTQKKAKLDLDNRFHLLLAEAGGNTLLHQEIARCNRRVRAIQWLKLDPPTLKQAYPEHLKILAALEKHDPHAAQAAMNGHLEVALKLILKEFE
ncbi:MAG TPA: GntR family transcriptional regulator [Planctomycetota bacterium]|jgi:DNA-binding GntR family transcriptional regulator|nr:GntR family transcriptional regulator [Planctomycetota bacterium]